MTDVENNHVDILVISAHVGDFVWRSAGTIAKYASNGKKVQIVVLTFGERGESAGAWRNGAKSIEEVKNKRKSEAEAAAKALGNIPITFMDWDDHLLVIDHQRVLEIAKQIRKHTPDIILTHSSDDETRPDHNAALKAVGNAMRLAAIDGVKMEYPPTKQPEVFGFDPHISDEVGFFPAVYINITPVYDRKLKAMECMESQQAEIPYYSMRDEFRGKQSRRFGWPNSFKYAEAFSSQKPLFLEEFP